MLKRFDHIIKNALENYMAPHIPDWDVFYDLLLTEQDAPMADDQIAEDEFGQVLADLDYTGAAPAWEAFENRLDEFNNEMDQDFDQTVGDALEHIPEATWGAGQWSLMSSRLDNLNNELDTAFDQTVCEALVSIPESSWKERHWEMLSSRLDELNNRPRILMMK